MKLSKNNRPVWKFFGLLLTLPIITGVLLILLSFQSKNKEEFPKEAIKKSTIQEKTIIKGLTKSLDISDEFKLTQIDDSDRSYHSDIAFYETVLSYHPIDDPRPVFLLANAYIITNQQEYGIAFFEKQLSIFEDRMSKEQRSTYLAAYALLRATYAENVFLLKRIGWVNDTFDILEEAIGLSPKNPLAHWSAGIIYAQVPSIFNKKSKALSELLWLENHPELEPTTGFYREVFNYIGKLYLDQGNDELAEKYLLKSGYDDYEPKVLFTGWFSTTKEKGILFATKPWIEEVVPNKIFAVRGFGFSDLHFVVTKNGKELISIDAGTQPYSMEEGYKFLTNKFPNLPPLTKVFITHAHWDHIGGYTYLKSLNKDIIFYGRENYHSTIERVLRNHSYHQFRGESFKDSWVEDYHPDEIIDSLRILEVDGSKIEFIPVKGGETEDALLIHFHDTKTMFMGDALMPFYGEPWVEEGFIEEAMDVMDKALIRQPKRILHGHFGITILYNNVSQLTRFREAYDWLVKETVKHVKNGYSAKDIIRLNLIPPGLQNHPNVFFSYLAPRDHIISRTTDKLVGIWQEEKTGKDPQGLNTITSIERGRLLELYFNLSANEVSRALRKMLDNGDNELALQMAVAAEERYKNNRGIIELKEEAADRLRSSVQFFDPFRFVTYTEIINKEQKQTK